VPDHGRILLVDEVSQRDCSLTYLPSFRFENMGKAAVIALIVAGVICLSEAAWIHAKASLAQALIGAAWRREQAGSGSGQPWPWADTRPLAKLTFGEDSNAPRLLVLEGASGRNLAFGPAHDPASVAPGEAGNSVIEGHRDTHFALLRGIKVGDTLHVETLGGHDIRFSVTSVGIIDSRRARISLHADTPRLTLVTCYPFDAVVPGGPLRFIVTADRMEL
jgi:sortase A